MAQNRTPRGTTAGGEFATTTQARSGVTLGDSGSAADLSTADVIMEDGFNLTQAEPPQVDERLAEIWSRYYQALDQVQRAENSLAYLTGVDFRGRPRETDPAKIEAAEDKVTAAYDAATLVYAEMTPYNKEYDRRPWNRAYLVDNTNGHLHRDRRCSTCFPTTRFHWVTELSGQAEAEIVEAAGESACTACYPTAPVDVLKRPSRINSPGRAERDALRAERAEKAAAKATKAILDPKTGLPLRAVERNFKTGALTPGSVFKTERGAELDAVSGLASELWYGGSHPDIPAWRATADAVAAAIAAKHNEDPEVVLAQLKAKAAAKHKRDSNG